MKREARGRRRNMVVKEADISDIHVTYDRDDSTTGDVECVDCILKFREIMNWPQAADHLQAHRDKGHEIRDRDIKTCTHMAEQYKEVMVNG